MLRSPQYYVFLDDEFKWEDELSDDIVHGTDVGLLEEFSKDVSKYIQELRKEKGIETDEYTSQLAKDVMGEHRVHSASFEPKRWAGKRQKKSVV